MSRLKQIKELLFKSDEYEQSLGYDKIIRVSCDRIRSNRAMPRAAFDRDPLLRLANSIAQYGMLQPLTVRKADIDDVYDYELIFGERRLRAAKLAELYYVPCIVIPADDRLSAELAIAENHIRDELDFFEFAYALRNLMEDFSLSQEEIAKRFSMCQASVADKLRLLRLNYKEQQAIIAFSLTERHAKAILKLEEDERRITAIYRIGELGLSAQDTEKYIDAMIATWDKSDSADIRSLPQGLSKSTVVTIKSFQKRLEALNKENDGVKAKMEVDNYGSHVELRITIPT